MIEHLAEANLQNSVAIGNYSVTTSGTKETTGKVGEITYGNFAGALTHTNNVVSVGGKSSYSDKTNKKCGSRCKL